VVREEAVVLWAVETFLAAAAIQAGAVIQACRAGDAVPIVELNTIPFGEGATSNLFCPPFVHTKPLPQSDVFSVQDLIPTRNTKEMQSGWSSVSMENGWTRPWETRLSVSCLTLVLPAAGTLLATSATPARCVVASLTDLINEMPENMFPIITKLKPDVWECALKDVGIL
jgi:hypothetical protein